MRTLIGCEYPCDCVAQDQTHHGQPSGDSPEVIAHVAFHIQTITDAIFKFGNGMVKVLALFSRPLFKNFYWKSGIHAAFFSFWIQIWSCFKTSRVRVGAICTAFMRLTADLAITAPITR